MTHVIFVRHGITRENIDFTLIGRTDPPLHPYGRLQAQAVAAVLRSRSLSAIVSSPLKRSVQTAEVIAEPLQMSVEVAAELTEIDLGIVDGLSSFTAYAQHQALMDEALNPSLEDFAFPEGESRSSALHRLQRTLDELVGKYPQGTVCVITHGGPLGLWLAHLHGEPLGQFRSWQPEHGSLTSAIYAHGRYTVQTFNQLDHLPTELDSLIQQAREALPET